MSDAVRVERDGAVATVVLARPERRNALSLDMVHTFEEVVRGLAEERELRAVVLTGAGRAFCAGADFTALGALAAQSGLEGPLAMHAAIERLYRAFLALDELGVPLIAAVNGAAVGGGLGIALLCDIRIVAEDAKIGANFSQLGFHSGMGITALLPAAIGYEAAAELLFTGALIRGREAVALGLARRALPADEVLPAAVALAQQIAESAPLAVRWMKRTLRTAARRDLPEALRAEAMAQALLLQSGDAQRGVGAMLSKKKPRFKGS